MRRKLTGFLLALLLVLSCLPLTARADEEDLSVYEGIDYSLVYDFDFYVSYNLDVGAIFGNNPAGALHHFVNYGMAEGRRGNAYFDVHAYKNAYGDLQTAYGENIPSYYLHFIRFGYGEGRNGLGGSGAPIIGGSGESSTYYQGYDYSPIYDFDYYISHNPDVLDVYGYDEEDVLGHFVKWGMSEGRQGCESFNVYVYRNRYADLREAYGDDLKAIYMHYLKWGLSEGRSGSGTVAPPKKVTVLDGIDYSAVYDYDYYIDRYSDVRAVYGGDREAVLRHFVRWGMSERRQAIATFNVNSYRNLYQDLRMAYGTNYPKYYLHYIKYGQKEGRTAVGYENTLIPITTVYGYDISSIYDYNYYISHNPDVVEAYGRDDAGAIKHFANYGIFEGRKGKASFDQADYEWFKTRFFKDEMFLMAQDYISSTNYLIMIDLEEKEFGVYQGYLDNWGLVWKAQCAVGAPETPTPVDATEVYEKYLWFDSGDVRLWYATPFNGSNYIHSVTYYPDDGPYEVEDPTVGAAISHGCIRLELSRAKWVYDNIPIGTLVVTFE